MTEQNHNSQCCGLDRNRITSEYRECQLPPADPDQQFTPLYRTRVLLLLDQQLQVFSDRSQRLCGVWPAGQSLGCQIE